MPDSAAAPRHWWQTFRASGHDGKAESERVRMPTGEDLAALRRGAGRPPGSVPEMWPFYRVRDDDSDEPSRQLEAEHLALTLFGFHQQSEHTVLMHRAGVPIGTALRTLRASDRYRERTESLDKRVAAAATANSFAELGWHLRTLVTLLKNAELGFDYTLLTRDLIIWQCPGGPDRIRRSWGRDYFVWGKEPDEQRPTILTS